MSFVSRLQFQGKRLLIVDDNPGQLRDFAREYHRRGFEVITLLGSRVRNPNNHGPCEAEFDGVFHNGEEFKRIVAALHFDAMLTDRQIITRFDDGYHFWGDDATKVLHEVKPGLPVVMHTTNELGKTVSQKVRDEDAARLAMESAHYQKNYGGLGLFYKGDHEAICQRFAEAFGRGRSVA